MTARRVELGLRENRAQFTLLVAVNAFVGAMVGLERTALPLIGSEDFGLASNAAVLSFIVAFGAAKALTKSPPEVRARITQALERLAEDASQPGRIGGKTVRTIQGVADSFHRLRVGDFRVMYDVIDEDHVILVLGIVHRADLERWIRNR